MPVFDFNIFYSGGEMALLDTMTVCSKPHTEASLDQTEII